MRESGSGFSRGVLCCSPTAWLRALLRLAPAVLALSVCAGLIGANGNGCSLKPGIDNATCLQCHDGRTAPDQRDFAKSPHRAIGCQQCHGNGEAHVRAGGRGGVFIVNPSELPFQDANAFCAECHVHEDELAGYSMSPHAASGAVGCNDCHNVHAENGMAVNLDDGSQFTTEEYAALCGRCHENTVDQYLVSVHAEFGATCAVCHDMHVASQLRVPVETNAICLQCHAGQQLGFTSDAIVDQHTGVFHPVDPAGSGASRCAGCHMVPTVAFGTTMRDHTMLTVPPSESVQAVEAGVTPVPPNSCSGAAGCHDPNVPGSGSTHLPADVPLNNALQSLYDAIGQVP